MTTASLSGANIRVRRGDLSQALARAAHERGLLAIDTETTGLDSRSAALCTVQVHVPGSGTEILMADRAVEPVRLLRLLADAEVVKVFHHATFDLGFIRNTYRSTARMVNCTKVAAKLLWPEDKELQSLRGLAKHLLGVEMDKTERTSDWSQSDLTDAQLRYAAMDAEVLPPLLEAVREQLTKGELIMLAEACWNHIPTRVELNERGLGDVFTY